MLGPFIDNVVMRKGTKTEKKVRIVMGENSQNEHIAEAHKIGVEFRSILMRRVKSNLTRNKLIRSGTAIPITPKES